MRGRLGPDPIRIYRIDFAMNDIVVDPVLDVAATRWAFRRAARCYVSFSVTSSSTALFTVKVIVPEIPEERVDVAHDDRAAVRFDRRAMAGLVPPSATTRCCETRASAAGAASRPQARDCERVISISISSGAAFAYSTKTSK